MDEILNSTNHEESTKISSAICKKLNSSKNNMSIITSHNTILTELEKTNDSINYKMDTFSILDNISTSIIITNKFMEIVHINASAENFQVASMEMQDNLVNSVNDQMSNADTQYIENLKNPQFWYSPQAHNIEYYNEKGFDPTTGQPTSESMAAYEEYKALAEKDQVFADKYFDKIYKPKKNNATDVNITRDNEETARYGKETSREKDLLRSKRELRKWILGYK